MRYYQFVTIIDLSTLILLISVNHLIMCHTASSQNQGQCPTLYLLNVEPYPDESANTWDEAFELIPAGHLAAEQINNHSDVLPGHELKLIDINSEACGISIISKGIANVYRELVNPNPTCIVGVIGLFCSPVTSAVSPIISHPNIGGYVHIAASASPVHRATDNPSSTLFHIIGSSSVLNEATLALMHTYNWKRITTIHNESHFYFRSSAHDFIKRVVSNPEYELLAHVQIADYALTDTMGIQAFNIINNEGSQISYWSVTYHQAAYLLCRVYPGQIKFI